MPERCEHLHDEIIMIAWKNGVPVLLTLSQVEDLEKNGYEKGKLPFVDPDLNGDEWILFSHEGTEDRELAEKILQQLHTNPRFCLRKIGPSDSSCTCSHCAKEDMRQYHLRVLEMKRPKIRNGVKLFHPRHVRQALFRRKR